MYTDFKVGDLVRGIHEDFVGMVIDFRNAWTGSEVTVLLLNPQLQRVRVAYIFEVELLCK
jgi:hypothetical protein